MLRGSKNVNTFSEIMLVCLYKILMCGKKRAKINRPKIKLNRVVASPTTNKG